MGVTPDLYAHQKASIKFLSTRPRVLDTSDPGTGKTRVHLEDFAKRRKRGGKCALVIAPKSLLRSAWANDIRQFAPQLKVSVATAKNRAEAFAEKADIYVTNVDAVNWLAKQKDSFFNRFDTIIFDEITAFKHQTSLRSRSANAIKKHFPIRRGLTGTPNPNGICDLWGQAFLIDDGRALGKSFFMFRNNMCTSEQVGQSEKQVKWIDKPNAEAIAHILLKAILIRHVFEDCVDIPPNFTYNREVELNDKHRKLYAELEAMQVLRHKDKVVSAVNAAVVYTKLMQLASGAAYSDDGEYALIDTDRYNLIMDLVEERKHSLVFFNWKHQRDELVKEATARGISYVVLDGDMSHKTNAVEDAVKHFQSGFYQVLFAHPKTAGHGLTLVKATSTIWASPTYNLEHFVQANRRIYRIGQTQKTETIVITASGTVDEKVWDVLQGKKKRMDILLDFFKGVKDEISMPDL